MGYQVPHYINGNRAQEKSGRSLTIFNSATGEALGEVSFASRESADEAIAAAKAAAVDWGSSTLIKRSKILFKFREAVLKDRDNLARIVTSEHGKTLEDAKGSVDRAIEVIEFNCGLLQHLQGTCSMDISSGIDCQTWRQPLGVCAGVSPFNFPVMVPVWMMIPAISCGNSFILKPSEQAPSAPLRLMELLSDAGLPDGVANCLNGDRETVDYLINHPDIQALTAVASTPVAEHIYTRATALGKRAHSFGGAKNHCVVMPDANIDLAANAITGAAYGSAGERCMALSVVVAVGEPTADNLIQAMQPLIKAMKIGPGSSSDSDMGPLISKAHQARVLQHVEQGIQEGAKLLIDGRAYSHPEYPDGYYMGPCLFDDVNETMSIYQNEIFGPVLVILRVANFEEALALVNRNQYGNGTAIFTQDGYTARTYAHQVQVGMVGINIPIPVPVASHPFGGWKRSSFGDTNMHALESINFYTRRKSATIRWPVTMSNENMFVMPSHR